MPGAPSVFDRLRHRLIVSCQPVVDGPMDNSASVVGFALAAEAGGAGALRIESVAYLEAVRSVTSLPIIGIVKRHLSDSPVIITPLISDVEALCRAGADIVAFDATVRQRPASVAALVDAAHRGGKLTMADCSSIEDAWAALDAGVDCVGSTLSGYVGGQIPDEPDFALLGEMAKLSTFVIAEGRIKTLEHAAQALRLGADAVVVGSAITRTEHLTGWYADAIGQAARRKEGRALAIDIGGTKLLAALVQDGHVIDKRRLPTDRTVGPQGWIDALARAAGDWRGTYDAVGAAVTGIVDDGLWSALNRGTLDIPDDYPLQRQLAAAFGTPALALNDAQAAAWGEYRFGAGEHENMVFLTISTGLGGGIVLNGSLRSGLAGHYGILRGYGDDPARPFEDGVAGRHFERAAAASGHPGDAEAVFSAAAQGAHWARDIIEQSARQVAVLCQDIQLTLDPRRIVVGGGIGLAPGYLASITAALPNLGPRLGVRLVPARCGPRAGIVGVADLAFDAI
ncbi:MAG: putative N-acetylmannosamine-6-phosphate 2-epimerase [Devosia sp.]